MSTVQPTYVNHAHLPGTSRVPSNIEEVLAAALAELAGKIDKNKAMHHGASEFSEENTYPAGIFVWYTDTSVPENSGLYICKEDVTEPGPWTGSANWTSMNSVSSLFTSANTSLTAMLPYGSVIHDSVSVTLTDGAINALPAFASGDTPVLTVPLPADGKTTDLIIRADCTTVCPADLGITVSGVTWRDISGDTMFVGKVYWIAIVVTPTDTAGEYDGVMSIKELKERTVTA